MLRRLGRLLIAAAVAVTAAVSTSAQEAAPPPVQPADYGKWERLGFSTPLSPDGKWLAVPITRVDGSSELQIFDLEAGGDPVRVEEGESPVFASDSTWLGYRIGHSEVAAEALRERREDVRNKLGVMNLVEGTSETIDDVARFAFGDGGAYLAMLRYGADPEEGARATANLVVRDHARGTELTIGNVAEFEWQDEGSLLAVVVDTGDDVGNGVQLYDAASGTVRVLESAKTAFKGLAWREDSSDLAFFREVEDETHTEPTHQVVVWRDLAGTATRAAYDPAADDAFPTAMRLAEHRSLDWSDDGATVFFGAQEWHAKPAGDSGDAAMDTGEGTEGDEAADADDTDAAGESTIVSEFDSAVDVEPSDVEVWHSQDETVIPMQKVFRNRLAQATYLMAWQVGAEHAVRLGSDLDENVTRLEGDRYVVESDRTAYQFDNQFDRDWVDLWLVEVATGARTKVIESTGFFYGGSATGRYLLFFRDDHFWTYDVSSGATHNVTAAAPVSFVNHDYDTPVWRQQPPWFPGGWLADDAALLLHDEFNVWAVAPDGSAHLRLVDGDAESLRHRVVDVDSDNPGVDPARVYFSLYGEWSKQFGYASADLSSWAAAGFGSDGPVVVQRRLLADSNIGRLRKAEDAEVYSYVAQGFDDSPDVFVGDAALSGARQVTATNPFQADHAWGRSELIEYESAWGRRMQGALFYPADYEPGRQYPMVVYVYERLSQTVHSYTPPSERDAYNTSVFNAEGYFVLRPDIVFRNRLPGTSAVESIVPAVEAAVATGMIDADRVGLVGHSWGGYEAAFVPTQTDVFATSIAGAALTNFFSMFGTVHWNQGLPETDHFETGQARMEVPYWEDLDAYVRESPVLHITNLETPMMLFFGDKDGTVDWHQGVEMYNYARRAGKFLVMLVYPGENHSNRQKNNQVDYHHRVLQWFGHFLKGDDAPDWITSGKPVLERARELEALKARR